MSTNSDPKESPPSSSTTTPYNLRSRPTTATTKMAGEAAGAAAQEGSSSTRRQQQRQRIRTSPYLPTPTELVTLLVYPTLLVFGTLFSVLSPETRNAPYDPVRQSHLHEAAPSYFARKDNLLNVLFVKQGWAWITVAFWGLALLSSTASSSNKKNGINTQKVLKAAARWALVTGWWILVTQWCFGPPLVDRGFRFTGGRCEVAIAEAEAILEEERMMGWKDQADAFTAGACRKVGGRWNGGHDISGHVFLLVLGSFCLLQELGWPLLRRMGGGGGSGEERCVVMSDGAVKGAGAEAELEGDGDQTTSMDLATKFSLVVVGLCWWMLLMTAIYFHTWFEKLTGLITALLGIYAVYIVPRFVPAVRAFIGLPGI